MSAFPVARYRARGGVLVPSIPWVGDPDPGYTPPEPPDVPGAAGEEYRVAVGGFPSGRRPVVLWGATITDLNIRRREDGGNEVTVTCPATPQAMRILGLPYSGEDNDGQLYTAKNGLSWELLVGDTLTGKVKWRFVVRDRIEQANGVLTMRAVGWVAGVTSDRNIGAPSPKNLLNEATGIDSPTGWVAHGAGTAFGAETGGPASDGVLWVTGTPDRFHYIEKTVRYKLGPHPWGRQRIAGTSLVKLPSGLDIDDYGLVTVAIFDVASGLQVWPPEGGAGADPEAGIVTSDMARGSWEKQPIVGIGKLPTPPYDVTVRIRLHPVDETSKVYFDGREIVRRENTSTVSAVDLTHHVTRLGAHAQTGRTKSTWGIDFVTGAPTGIEEVGTWWHADGQSLNEALEAIGGRGVDIFDQAGPGRVVKASARRGVRREDLIVHDWDVCGVPAWGLDMGAVRTAIRATSSAGSIWGGADEGAIDTSKSNGQVIDVTLSGPSGMTPTQLRQWVREQLGSLATVPLTCTLPLRWKVGQRLGVGDAVRVAIRANAAAEKNWMRVIGLAPDFDKRVVAVTFGYDPEEN